LTLSIPEIQEVIDEMENESKAFKKDLFKLTWYMRGGLTLEQAYMLDYTDRSIIADIIKDNLETTKETNMPFF
jgi:hypothetical protein